MLGRSPIAWSEDLDRMVRNEEVAGSNPASGEMLRGLGELLFPAQWGDWLTVLGVGRTMAVRQGAL